MRNLLLLVLFSSLQLSGQEQWINGTVTDQEHRNGIPYVSIGIPGADIGTVSDSLGIFQLKVQLDNVQDTLLFVSLGYETQKVCLKDLLRPMDSLYTIEMAPSPLALAEVVLTNGSRVQKTIGNQKVSKKMSAGFKNAPLGNEMGIKFKIETKPLKVDSLHLHIQENTAARSKFRLNFYSMPKGVPDQKLVAQDILISIDNVTGPVSIDLDRFGIVLDQDFIATLELVEPLLEDQGIFFSANLIGPKLFYRKTSHSKWKKTGLASINMAFTVQN